MKRTDENYQSFLLRCWHVPSASASEPPEWRFALRDVSAEPADHTFSNLEQLVAFISAELQQSSLKENGV